MKRKKFKLNGSKWKKIDAIVVSIIFLFCFISIVYNSYYFVEEMNFPIFIFLMFYMFLTFIPFIMIYIAVRAAVKSNQKKNVIFETVDNIDYYRDNLGEISPATISVMMNLDIENEKDICAMLLYYKSKKIIDLDENKKIVVKNTVNLKESDRLFLNWLKNKNPLILNQWKNQIIDEAVNDGYLQDKTNYNFSKGCLVPIVTFIILTIIVFCLIMSFKNNASTVELELERLQIDQIHSFAEQLKCIINNPIILGAIIKVLVFVMLIIVGNALPAFSIIYFLISIFTTKRVKRTKLGNQLTERIYAMKNFIHDFSNLSDKTKEHLVLWDYFLIYAVVLEENDKIVNEISNYMNINIIDFMVNKN